MRRNFAYHCKLMRRLLFQNIDLETEQSRERQQQHDRGDRHDHKGDLLRNRSVAQVLHGARNFELVG